MTLDKRTIQPAFMPVKIKTDLTRDEVAAVESWKIEMPGVEVREEIKRTNIYGDVAAHLLGYIGEVNPTELPILNKKGSNTNSVTTPASSASNSAWKTPFAELTAKTSKKSMLSAASSSTRVADVS